MKRSTITVFLLAMLMCSVSSFGQYNNLEFVENKGQWNPQVKYKGDFTTGAFFLTGNGFRVLQSDPQDLQALAEVYHGRMRQSLKSGNGSSDKKVIVHSHVYDVQFVNANTPAIVPDKPLNTYNNYFIGNDKEKWKGNCRIFQAVVYKSIYKGVDVRYYTDNGRLKYDILVHPGADVASIAMKYDGADQIKVKNEELVIKTSLGDNHELQPYSYQVVNGQKKEVKCSFRIKENTVHFEVEGYSKNATLVIDPTMIFSTFTGSSSDNWGYTATYGADGSFFAGGIVFGTGFPVSTGAYQTTWNNGADEGGIGGYDIGIIKFNPTGTNRVYATYLGGNGNEQPHSMIADAQGNLVVAGRTNSGNFPVIASPVGTGGGYDIFITKFNASGDVITGSLKIGGSADDGANIGPKYVDPQGEISLRQNYGDDARSEVIFDGSGNILLASNTRSVNFPVLSAFQNTIGGLQDAVLIKAAPDLSVVYMSTYLGGNDDDAAFVLAVNPLNNQVYVGGNTLSNNLPGDTTGVLNPVFSGNTDGFVSILSPGGSLLKTCYFGTGAFDMLYGIQFDKLGYPYIMGTTRGTWPVKNAMYSEAGGKQFICKLKPDLSDYVYSTTFGTGSAIPNISPIAFLVDKCENVYVSGWGGNVNSLTGFTSAGTTGLGVTGDALQKTTDGSDFYFFVLERSAKSRLYASFFGQNGGIGEHVDGGTSRFDRDGVIYQALCANCQNNVPFPTTPGAWATHNGSQNCNLAAVKIAFNLSGITNSIKSSIDGSTRDTVGCVPLRVNFADTLAEGKKYIWSYGDGSNNDTTLTATSGHLFNAIGVYQVSLITIDSSKCNISDTARLFINVKTYKVTLDFDWQKLPPCDSFRYMFINKSTVSPATRSFKPTSFVWDFGDGSPVVISGLDTIIHNFPSSGIYNVKLSLVDTNFCNQLADTTKTLRIANNITAGIETAEKGCAPYNAAFSNTTIAGEKYLWYFGDGDTSGAENPHHLYSVPGVYTVKLIAYNPGSCNKTDTATFIITVYGSPVAGFTFSPNPPQENKPTDFINTSVSADWFWWQFGDGDSLYSSTTESVEHQYNKTQVFKACITAYTKAGCVDTFCLPVAARILPLLDVPTALTPNHDGINDKVFVHGFGIVRMLWRIYDRWGTMIYESTDKNQGWDGTYKGSAQPMEVYHYTLDVIYSDDSTIKRQGDITLIR